MKKRYKETLPPADMEGTGKIAYLKTKILSNWHTQDDQTVDKLYGQVFFALCFIHN
jgi:hypothetical protein